MYWGIDVGLRLSTAKSILKYRDGEQYLRWLAAVRQGKEWSARPIPSPTSVDEKAAPAIAYANHGRWVADCPSGCGGAMLVEPGLPFICGECGNVEIEGKWRRIAWPAEAEQIDELLSQRKLAHQRNWWPREALEELEAENEAHGSREVM